MLEIDPRLRLD